MGLVRGELEMSSRQQARRADIARRLSSPASELSRCIVLECSNPTRAAAGEGFDRRLCRRHAEQYAVHGSPYRKSYTAAALKPHRDKARTWLRENDDHPAVKAARERVRILYRSAGPQVEAFRLKGLGPKERARKAWARLREAGVAPDRVLEAWLALAFATAADPEADTRPEFQRVQAAKLIHRLASGTHKQWVVDTGKGQTRIERLDVYPRSRGKVLRYLGEDIARACETLLDVASVA